MVKALLKTCDKSRWLQHSRPGLRKGCIPLHGLYTLLSCPGS